MKNDILGATIDFDYLGDDDDDDSTGGAPPAEFAVYMSSDSDGTEPYGATVTFTATPNASGAQTNGSIYVQVTESYGFDHGGYDDLPVTTALDGWSQNGWTRTSAGVYWNLFTKASVAAGTDTIQFTVTIYRYGDETSGGSLHATTLFFAAPHTDQATSLYGAVDLVVVAGGGG